MTLRRALCLLAVTVVAAGTIYAQSFTATVRGTVVDQSAAVVPGAKIVVTEADRGTTSSTIADEQGRYTVTALQPGNYILTVSVL
ncbi:MAG: hypothetical protein C0504_15520 [Candidatus Solibacter sp.]|nr:hypothetical protein [Candidatus Solibacter sp.]